ncbi:MAG: arginine--tRNA ligase, partial [Actinobacteria bacterium]|nr:arginine--tRNA ligase [Actinomycetota bacterium]NDF42936.1 arginine--tRNA ligase [Actinomycetota bacterium]
MSAPIAPLTPQDLVAGALRQSLAAAIASGKLSESLTESLAALEIPLERPKNRDHGDYASSVALVLAKSAGTAPRVIADALTENLRSNALFSKVEIAGPGFINLTLATASHGAIVNSILTEAENFGRTQTLT